MAEDYNQLFKLRAAERSATEHGFHHTALAISKMVAEEVAQLKNRAEKEDVRRASVT